MVESLESRRLFSGDAGDLAGITYVRSGETLHLTGTAGDDTVILAQAAADAPLVVIGITGAGEAAQEFAGVTRVLIDTGDGRDAVLKFAGVTASFLVQLGAGDDVAYDEAAPDSGTDVILGGDGDDELLDFAGDNVLIGGQGNDFIVQP